MQKAPDSFEFFARYLLSGFVIILVRSKFIVAERPKPMDTFIEAIIFSLINQFVFSLLGQFWLLLDLLGLEFNFPVNFVSKALFFGEILILPAGLGFLFGRNLSKGWNHALLRKLSMPIEHPTRRAYDYAFNHQRTQGFVIISFEDGTVVYGYFGDNSLAANDSDRSDIFLERLYDVDVNGKWTEMKVRRSAVVSLSGVRSIEFLDNRET